jgi:hypothetical protein
MILIVLSFIINLLARIVNPLGALGLFLCIIEDDFHILTISGALAVVGFIYGIFAYKLGIPPRWFWSRSINEIFSFSVTAVLGYAGSFALWPPAVYFVQYIIDKL